MGFTMFYCGMLCHGIDDIYTREFLYPRPYCPYYNGIIVKRIHKLAKIDHSILNKWSSSTSISMHCGSEFLTQSARVDGLRRKGAHLNLWKLISIKV